MYAIPRSGRCHRGNFYFGSTTSICRKRLLLRTGGKFIGTPRRCMCAGGMACACARRGPQSQWGGMAPWPLPQLPRWDCTLHVHCTYTTVEHSSTTCPATLSSLKPTVSVAPATPLAAVPGLVQHVVQIPCRAFRRVKGSHQLDCRCR